MPAHDWRTAAACRGVADADVFFPTAEAGPVYEAQVAVAKAICACCSVRAECLADALVRIPDGVAGGLSAEERRAYRAGRHRPVPAGGPASVLTAGLRHGARPAEVRAAGRVLLAAGRPVREVAARCGVTTRTAARWATTSTSATGPADGGAEKGRGASRALPLIFPSSTQPRTPAVEGPRA